MHFQKNSNAFASDRSSLFILFVLLINTFSCTYAPEDENFVGVNQSALGLAGKVNLDESRSGAIELYDEKEIVFTVSPSDRKYYSAEIFIDNEHITTINSSSGYFSFALDPLDLSDGTRDLKIVITYSSGTGSLADKLNEEGVTIEKNYKLLIDNIPTMPVEKPGVAIVNGKLMVSWNKPAKNNFISYMLYRRYYEGDKVVATDSFKISDTNIIAFHDRYYVGGKVAYNVNIQGNNFYVHGVPENFDCVPLEFTFNSELENPQFTYTKSKLYSTENLIEFSMTGDRGGYRTYGMATAGTIETTNVHLGASLPYEFKVIDKTKNGYNNHSYKIKMTAYKGRKIKPFIDVEYAPSLGAYYTANYDYKAQLVKVYKVDATSLAITDSLAFPARQTWALIFSPGNVHNYVLTEDAKFHKLDLSSLEITETVDLTMFGFFQIDPSTMLTDANLFAAGTDLGACYVIDLNTKSVVWSQTSYRSPSLSPDGEYLFFNKVLYKGGAANAWNQIAGKISAAEEGLIFRKSGTNKAYIHASSKVYQYDLTAPPNNFGFLLPTTFSGGVFDGLYDMHSDTRNGIEFDWNHNGTFTVVSAEDFKTIKRQIPAYSNPGWGRYLNDVFFHNNGYLQK